ncbi:MAG: thioesterase family protein [Frankiaceae bacterium]|nr:thioesterase family protein [Frankiaceae bacterium]
MADALYLPSSDPDVFTATTSTQGPWDPTLQHGGPPSALLTRAAERAESGWPFTVVRVAVEILGPIPVGEVRVSHHVARSGKSVELVETELSAGGRAAAKARVWRIRKTELDVPQIAAVPTDRPALPSERIESEHWPAGFLEAMDFRYVGTGGWSVPGPAAMWANLLVPLVDGEQITPLQRLMTLADCGNGVSSALPPGWMFINPDLTVHLARYPAGEWMCIDAATTVDPAGFGVAASTLYDLSGRVGHGAQSLFVSSP